MLFVLLIALTWATARVGVTTAYFDQYNTFGKIYMILTGIVQFGFLAINHEVTLLYIGCFHVATLGLYQVIRSRSGLRTFESMPWQGRTMLGIVKIFIDLVSYSIIHMVVA
ncbi:hypothetical protein HYV70_02100 [Candidatus Uhrbacteria bacterium]|nr:hypothetical protein [Candidatus Uhrbacteria bacterium]